MLGKVKLFQVELVYGSETEKQCLLPRVHCPHSLQEILLIWLHQNLQEVRFSKSFTLE